MATHGITNSAQPLTHLIFSQPTGVSCPSPHCPQLVRSLYLLYTTSERFPSESVKGRITMEGCWTCNSFSLFCCSSTACTSQRPQLQPAGRYPALWTGRHAQAGAPVSPLSLQGMIDLLVRSSEFTSFVFDTSQFMRYLIFSRYFRYSFSDAMHCMERSHPSNRSAACMS